MFSWLEWTIEFSGQLRGDRETQKRRRRGLEKIVSFFQSGKRGTLGQLIVPMLFFRFIRFVISVSDPWIFINIRMIKVNTLSGIQHVVRSHDSF